MKYKEAIEYIEKWGSLGIVPGLSTMEELLKRLGNPEKGLKFIHIAGTNGKGSVLAFLSQILYENKYKVGRYLSPTISSYEERFQIQQKQISKAEVARLVDEVAWAADKMEEEGLNHPTAFELETAMAFLLFQKKKCDLVVLETGMGGRLDATNVIEDPLVCVITSISKDHMQFLGETLEEITLEKAGIMKKDAKVVTATQPEKIIKLLKEQAKKAGAEEFIKVEEKEIKKIKYGLEVQRFSYKRWKDMEISMAGIWQVENACIALEAVMALEDLGYHFQEEKIRKGLKEAVWKGRFQVLAKKPYFIVDGAHNYSSASKLKKSLEFYFTNKQIIYIIGMFRDKEYDQVLEETCPLASHIITISLPNHNRSLSSLELAEEAKKFHPRVTAATSIEEAIELAYLLADKNSVILAFGSLSYLGRCMEIMEKSGTGFLK